jgi:hypothetical protein
MTDSDKTKAAKEELEKILAGVADELRKRTGVGPGEAVALMKAATKGAEKKIKAAAAKADKEKIKSERQAVIRDVRAQCKKYGITATQLKGALKTRSRSKAAGSEKTEYGSEASIRKAPRTRRTKPAGTVVMNTADGKVSIPTLAQSVVK